MKFSCNLLANREPFLLRSVVNAVEIKKSEKYILVTLMGKLKNNVIKERCGVITCNYATNIDNGFLRWYGNYERMYKI